MAEDERARLEALGGRAVPDPEPGFVERLGERLRAAHAGGDASSHDGEHGSGEHGNGEHGNGGEGPSRPSSGIRRIGLLAPVLAAAAAVVVAVLVMSDAPEPALAMTTVSGIVEVERVDGSVEPAQEGTELREGDIVRVADGGRAEVDGVVVGPGEEVVVVDGAVRFRPRPRPDATTSTSRPPATTATTTATTTTVPPRPTTTTTTVAPAPTTDRPTSSTTTTTTPGRDGDRPGAGG